MDLGVRSQAPCARPWPSTRRPARSQNQSRRRCFVANRATLPPKWPPRPQNVADSCERTVTTKLTEPFISCGRVVDAEGCRGGAPCAKPWPSALFLSPTLPTNPTASCPPHDARHRISQRGGGTLRQALAFHASPGSLGRCSHITCFRPSV